MINDKRIVEDLSEIEFTDENCIQDSDGFPEYKDFVGFHTLENGMHFVGFLTAGDWEYELFVIIYWDGEQFRGYIPKCGNIYNSLNNKAIGNDDELDELFMCSQVGKYLHVDDLDYNWDLMKEDIMSYIIKK